MTQIIPIPMIIPIPDKLLIIEERNFRKLSDLTYAQLMLNGYDT